MPTVSQGRGIDTNVRHPKNKNAPRARFFLPLMEPEVRAQPAASETTFFRHKREQSSKGRGAHKGARPRMNSAKGAIHRCQHSGTGMPGGTPVGQYNLGKPESA
jgi:hypothetical protein